MVLVNSKKNGGVTMRTLEKYKTLLSLLIIVSGVTIYYISAAAYSPPSRGWIVDHYNPGLRSKNPQRFNGVVNLITSYARELNIPVDMAFAVAAQESHFSNEEGPTGEAGYYQIKPVTYLEYCGDERPSLDYLIWNWRKNIRCGLDILASYINKYGELEGLGKYNAGAYSKFADNNKPYVYHVYRRFGHIKQWQPVNKPKTIPKNRNEDGYTWAVDRYRPILQKTNPERRLTIANTIEKKSRYYDEDPLLMFAISIVRSNGLTNTIKASGRAGYMGLLPSEVEKVCGYNYTKKELLRHVKTNISCGIKIYSKLRDQYGELNAINAFFNGDGRIDRRIIYEVMMVYGNLRHL